MKEHIVKPGTYIPDTGFTYPEEPNTPFLNPKIKYQVTIDKDYPFLDKSFKHKFWSNFVYSVIFTLVFPVHRIRYGLKIEGRENYKKNKKLFKNGAMTISNHVYRWDFLAVVQAFKYRKLWFPARAAQLSGPDANLIKGAGGIPIPDTISAMKGFTGAFDQLHSKKKWIHVFPEAFRWDFYEPIRPFMKGAFTMALKYGIPIIPVAFSYRKPEGIYKLFKMKHPLVTLHIGTPVLPDENLASRREKINKMREETHKQIVAMAGIIQNKWDAAAD